MTAEQLEASRAERMRLNGNGALTLDEARTWIEETGLCLFLPRRQFSATVAPSFVEAVAGQRNAAPEAKHIALAEELLVRLESDSVAVRLNLLGQPGESPDYVVAAWVLPYVYALRGDRDWRRIPQLTGSRQVSPLAVQTYKLLEAAESAIPSLKHTLGREVTEQAVLRAITELWQQLRIIPVIAAPGQTPKWQLLRTRYQKAIAEGASTSQVTAISVLASIFLQAVIAGTMEDVELFLAPLTARSKVREVIRGLVATRQVHTISLGHAPHFYVAGTLPEFAAAPTAYASAAMPASAYFLHESEYEEERYAERFTERFTERFNDGPAPAHSLTPVATSPIPAVPAATSPVLPAAVPPAPKPAAEVHAPRHPAVRKPVAPQKSSGARPHFSRPAPHSRDRKPSQSSSSSRSARPANGARSGSGSRPSSARPSGTRWSSNGSHGTNGQHRPGLGAPNGNGKSNGSSSMRNGKPAGLGQHNGHSSSKPGAKSGALLRKGPAARKDARGGSRPGTHTDARSSARTAARPASREGRAPALTAGANAGNSKRYGFTAPARPKAKKRG